MPLELRKGFVAATALTAMAIVTCCFLVVRDTVHAASIPVQLAFSVLLIAAYGGMIVLLHRLLPIVLVRFWPSLDR